MYGVLNPGDSLTAVLSGAVTTTNPTYSVIWSSATGPQQAVGSLNGVTSVTLLSGSEKRIIESVNIYNADSASATVTLSRSSGGSSTTLFAYAIPVGYTLHCDKDGIEVTASTTPDGVGAAGTGTTAAESAFGPVHQTVLTMSDVSVTVANTTGVSFGGTKIYDFPAGRILILGATCADISFDLTDAGNVTPIDGTMGGDIAVGTTAPTDGTLTNADVDIIPSTSIDPISAGVAGAALSASAQFDGTGTAKDAFFNILIDDADVGDAASDVLLVNGTVTITWCFLGDY